MNADAKIILGEVCNVLGINEKDVLRHSRRREYVDARFIAVYFMRQQLQGIANTNTIGSWFGRKKKSAHCFVMHATMQVMYLSEYNIEFKKKFQKCNEALNYQVASIYNHIPQY